MTDDEREGGFGAFLFGLAVGAAIGFLFAPATGSATRRKLSRTLGDLKGLAEDRVDRLKARLADDDEAAAERSARADLERRLAEARRRRRTVARRNAADVAVEEDEPVA